jgi:signal transduction histidine kinase
MGMGDVNGALESNQLIGREADERAGLGLLSRFLGAVFLVLLGGLLLLDRSLSKANNNQAILDTQSMALLTETFMSAQVDRLRRIADVVAEGAELKDSILARTRVERLLAVVPGLRHAWVIDVAGHVQLDVSEAGANQVLSPGALARLQALRPANGFAVVVVPLAPRHAFIAIVNGPNTRQGDAGAITGLVFDGSALESWLERIQSDTRIVLAVLSGPDTVAFVGQPNTNLEELSSAEKIVRLPTGGTWRVVTAHALTTRWLRWALWALGVLGVLFLAVGLLREQRRAVQASSRSVELERLYRDVKRANQAKSEFLANVSHELRTPLNAIVGFVELLREGFYGDLSPRQIQPVDHIAVSATHLRHLVDQVLDIARIAAGRLEVHTETIVLRPFVLNIVTELESLVSEKGLNFSITVGASLPRVRTDPAHLRQILINLIGNAVKFTPTGTVSVRARLLGAPVQISQSRASDSGAELTEKTDEALERSLLSRAPRVDTWVALQVLDTGMGIVSTDIGRIFDEFEQVNAGPRSDSMERGTGLGLAISRRLARLLGGEITVESEIGQGSIFTVWLPVNSADLVTESIDTPFRANDVIA